jgi:hypothetical protein
MKNSCHAFHSILVDVDDSPGPIAEDHCHQNVEKYHFEGGFISTLQASSFE